MNRVKIAFIALFCAAFLAACGDTGDHFLEFRPNPGNSPTARPSSGPTSTPTTNPTTGPTVCPTNCTPTPTPVGTPATLSKISIGLPAGLVPNASSAGAYPLLITLLDKNGKQLPYGTPLVAPLIGSSNATWVLGFGGVNQSGAGYASYALTFAPSTGPVQGQAPGASVVALFNPSNASTGCSVPNPIVVTATDSAGNAPQQSFPFIGSQKYTVTSLTNFKPLTPVSASAAGIYPIYMTMNSSSGPIPNGLPLTNPVVLTSDDACVVGFGTSPNITQGTQTQAITFTAGTQIAYLWVNPGASTTSCPGSSPATVTASTAGTVLAKFQFSLTFPP